MSGNDKSDSGTKSFPITDPLLIQKLDSLSPEEMENLQKILVESMKELRENNMSKVNFLLQKLHDLRVLRSSCSDSNEGDFRVHLPEKDWDEIQRLVKEMREGR